MTGTVSILMLAATLAAGPGARDRNDADARTRYAAGEAAFREGRFEEAAHEFEEGYRLSPRPTFLLNVAHCWRRQGDLVRARAAYRKYLIVDPGSRRRVEVEAVLHELDLAIAEQSVLASPPAAPSPTVVSFAPYAGPGLPPPAHSPPPKPLYRRWWFWAGMGALAAVGATAGLLVSRAQTDDETMLARPRGK